MSDETPRIEGTALFTDLMAISRAAHRAGRHEAAYHALAAAMHAADDDGDASALADVIREAEAQSAWINRHAPEHRLSTSSAARHQHPGVYAMLVRQANAHIEILRTRTANGLSRAVARAMRESPADGET